MIPQSIDTLLDEWRGRVRANQKAHYRAARRLGGLNQWLGIPVVVLSAVAGTSVFASLGKQLDTSAKILVGLISVLAAVLSALQTFFRFSERAEQHRASSVRYGIIHREIERLQVLTTPSGEEARRILSDLEAKINTLEEQAPVVIVSPMLPGNQRPRQSEPPEPVPPAPPSTPIP